jgi:hypothetical protein
MKFGSLVTMRNGSSKNEPALDQSYGGSSANNSSISSKQKVKLERIKAVKKREIMGIMSEMKPELVLGMISSMKKDHARGKEERRGGTPKAA